MYVVMLQSRIAMGMYWMMVCCNHNYLLLLLLSIVIIIFKLIHFKNWICYHHEATKKEGSFSDRTSVGQSNIE